MVSWCQRAVLVLGFLSSGCLQEELNLPYAGYTPDKLNDGWQTTTPERARINADELERIIRGLHNGRFWQARSFLVIRDGALVAEAYLRDRRDQKEPRAIWSVTKQFMAILVGIAIDQQRIEGVNSPLSSCIEEIPKRYPDKQGITLENLLHMRSGIAYTNDGASGQTSQILRKLPSNTADFILSLPMKDKPGTVSDYNDGNPQLMSICLQRKLGEPVDAWAKQVLFEPLRLQHTRWDRYIDGTTLGAFGILSTPRELGKVGQLVLQRGQWEEQEIVSQDWIDVMTTDAVDSYNPDFGFGYWWWIDRGSQLVFMNGHGGQYVFIDRPSNTLVVITSEPNTQDEFQFQAEQAIPLVQEVLAALTD